MTAESPSLLQSAARPRFYQTTRWRQGRDFYLFVSPWVIGTILLTIFPLAYAFGVSLTNWDGISPGFKWVGFENYAKVLTNPETWASLGRTGMLALVVVPITVAGSLVLAVLLNNKVRFRAGWRTLIYLPAVVPPVAATLTWKLLFERDSGAVNAVLGLFGHDAVNWMTGQQVFVVLIVVMLWGIGGGVIINLAALQDVPQELLEAAELDGASPWRRFLSVTVPTISPVLLFQFVTTTIGVLQTFVPALLLSPGSGATAITSVPESNRVFMIDVYAEYFAFSRYGYASAMLWLFFVVILLITGVFFKVSGRTVFYAVDPSAGGRND
ncbi:carbohydrate ABC transporter permease [Terrabacter sp. GCM10028922]|uniref:carbohydrate ABC transporter permease n=1 Tax=Terrabacter sp. GCM10028922 TaxID=3273428 RepID=UPI0036079561